MRLRFLLFLTVTAVAVAATGCHGRFLRRGCCGSTTRSDLPPAAVAADYCPYP